MKKKEKLKKAMNTNVRFNNNLRQSLNLTSNNVLNDSFGMETYSGINLQLNQMLNLQDNIKGGDATGCSERKLTTTGGYNGLAEDVRVWRYNDDNTYCRTDLYYLSL